MRQQKTSSSGWCLISLLSLVVAFLSCSSNAFTMPAGLYLHHNHIMMTPMMMDTKAMIRRRRPHQKYSTLPAIIGSTRKPSTWSLSISRRRLYHSQVAYAGGQIPSSSSSINSALYAATDSKGEEREEEQGGEKKGCSVLEATFSLVKAILGAGALALPQGLAKACDHPRMLMPANVLIVALGILSAYTFHIYGRLARVTGKYTAAEVWQDVNQTPNKSRILSIANFVFCFGACLTYSLIIGDLTSSLMRGWGFSGLLAMRQTAILGVAATMLWPLCNLSSLAALAPVSIIGVLGMIVVTGFLAIRCPTLVPSSPYNNAALLGSVTSSRGGRFTRGTANGGLSLVETLPDFLQPQFRTYNRVRSPAPLVLISMACVAWMAHFSAPEFYHSLMSPTGPGPQPSHVNDCGDNKPTNCRTNNNPGAMKRFTVMTIAGYLMLAAFNVIILSLGFLTFGGNSAGCILNNYATSDWGATLSRLLIIISVVGSFPFLFGACRSAAVDLFFASNDDNDDDNINSIGTDENGRRNNGKTNGELTKQERKATSLLFSIIIGISMCVEDAGFSVAFNGALMGSAIIYIFPTLLFLKHTSSRNPKGLVLRIERWLCRGLICFGGISGVIGAVTAVLVSYFPHLLS